MSSLKNLLDYKHALESRMLELFEHCYYFSRYEDAVNALQEAYDRKIYETDFFDLWEQ